MTFAPVNISQEEDRSDSYTIIGIHYLTPPKKKNFYFLIQDKLIKDNNNVMGIPKSRYLVKKRTGQEKNRSTAVGICAEKT